MQTDNRFFDDLARVASGAAGTLAGLRHEIEALIRQRLDRLLDGMDLVSREEFDAVKAVAAKARLEQEALTQRLDDLERRLNRAAGPARPTARRKTATKAKPAIKAKSAPDI